MKRSILTACTAVAALIAAAPGASAQRIQSHAVSARDVPREAAYEGKLELARRWTDRLGENLLLLTRTNEFPSRGCEEYQDPCSDREIYGYHYVRRGGAYTLLWQTTDFERDCDFDLVLQYRPEGVAITDLDADGIAESTYVYMHTCTSDVSPNGMKLIMHEGAEKYAIRGSADISDGIGEEYGRGSMAVDPAFNRAPAAFREFAVRHWRRFERQASWAADYNDRR
ncbi:MAG TPA: hypothetical protein VFQ45_15435 [Longimicrobium sp.]|nr:hypothetical protein [Longimicrobium sp.]